MAIAKVSCTSCETEPKLIAPVEKRFTISEIGSTSSIDIAGRIPSLNWNRPRKVIKRLLCSSTRFVYRLNTSNRLLRVECCRVKTVSGSNKCGSPSRRH